MTTTAPTLAEYAQCFYPQPGCEQALLRLQDEGGLDVLLLLTACWLSVRGQPVEGTDWSAICAEQRPVHQQVIAPLRVARRAVRERGGHQGLYEQIKACEQEAEWQQLRHLGSFCERMGVVVTQAIGADGHLQAYCAAQKVEMTAALLHMLADLAGLVARYAMPMAR